IVPGGEPTVLRDDGTTAVVDGQQAFGHAVATLAMALAIAKARTHGVGFVTCYNSNHFGAAANYSMMALPHDMIGISLTNGPWPAVVPTFGRQSMLSTNPISLAAPAGREYPFVLDMATSTVAIGKLSVAARWARPIPEGWALDATGRPTTDAALAYETRLLTPLGGSREQGGHKGYGLAVMVDILSGVLAGASRGSPWRPGSSRSQAGWRPRRACPSPSALPASGGRSRRMAQLAYFYGHEQFPARGAPRPRRSADGLILSMKAPAEASDRV